MVGVHVQTKLIPPIRLLITSGRAGGPDTYIFVKNIEPRTSPELETNFTKFPLRIRLPNANSQRPGRLEYADPLALRVSILAGWSRQLCSKRWTGARFQYLRQSL